MKINRRIIFLGIILIGLLFVFFLIPSEKDLFNKDNYQLTGFAISEILGENYSLEIDGENYNPETEYQGIKEIIIKYNNKNKVFFEWNFSNEIDLIDLGIQIQSDQNSFGYTIINGIKTEKTIYVDRKTDSRIVCVKDKHVENIGEITPHCNGSSESFLKCEEISQEKGCQIAGDVLIVSGIKNSGVKEFYGDVKVNIILPEYGNCSTNWNCTEWSECLNGMEFRVCIDLNSCANESDKPIEERECEGGCNPEWICSMWEDCEKDKKQTRNCQDINDCEEDSGRPIEERECVPEGDNINKIAEIIFYSIFALILVAFLIYAYILLKKRYFPYSDQGELDFHEKDLSENLREDN